MAAGSLEVAEGDRGDDEYIELGIKEAGLHANADRVADEHDIHATEDDPAPPTADEMDGEQMLHAETVGFRADRLGVSAMAGIKRNELRLPTGYTAMRRVDYHLRYAEPVYDPQGGGWALPPAGITPAYLN